MWQQVRPSFFPFPPPTAASHPSSTTISHAFNNATSPADTTPIIVDLWRQLLILQQHAAAASAAAQPVANIDFKANCDRTVASAAQFPSEIANITSSSANIAISNEFDPLRCAFRPPFSTLPLFPMAAYHYASQFRPSLFPVPQQPVAIYNQPASWRKQTASSAAAAIASVATAAVLRKSSPNFVNDCSVGSSGHSENNSEDEDRMRAGNSLKQSSSTLNGTDGNERNAPPLPSSRKAEAYKAEQPVPSWLHPSTSNATVAISTAGTFGNAISSHFVTAPITVSAERNAAPHSGSSPLPSPSSIPYFALRRNAHRLNKPRRARTAFTNEQTDALEDEYKRNEYISKNRRHQLASKLNLTEVQIKIWYQNRRAKDKRIEKAKADRQTRYLTGTTTTADTAAAVALASFSSSNSSNAVSKQQQPTTNCAASVANAFLEYFRYHHQIPAKESGTTFANDGESVNKNSNENQQKFNQQLPAKNDADEPEVLNKRRTPNSLVNIK